MNRGNTKESDLNKLADMRNAHSVKCKCTHSMFMPVFLEKRLCSWCGRIVYNKTELGQKAKFRDNYKKAKRKLEFSEEENERSKRSKNKDK